MAESLTAQVNDLTLFLQRYRDHGPHPVLWIGAGSSAAAGYPTLGQLESRIRADLPGITLSGFALLDAYIQQYSKRDLELLLHQQLGQARPLAPLHEAIASLASAGVCPLLFTTNYDRLLENALTASGVPYHIQTFEANLTLQALTTVQLLKLHGDLGDWAQVVLTANSYDGFQRTYPLLLQQLNLNLRTRPVVFLGCSMQDPRLLDWLRALSEPEKANLYASRVLITETDWQALSADTQTLLTSANIKPITVPDYSSITSLLTQVAARFRAPAPAELLFTLTPDASEWTIVGPTPDSPPHRVPNPLNDAELLGWLRDLRAWSSQPLLLDDPQTPGLRARLEQLAQRIGARLTSLLLSPAARATVVQRLHALEHGRAQLTLRVAEQAPHGDQALALPWELLMPEANTFAVQAGQLDLVRDAVQDGAPTLTPPGAPLRVAVCIAAPEEQAALRYVRAGGLSSLRRAGALKPPGGLCRSGHPGRFTHPGGAPGGLGDPF